MNLFICKKCGHIAFNEAPEKCPVCFVSKEAFSQNDAIFTESEEKSKEAAVKHIPSVTVNKECKLIPEEACTDVIVRIGETLHPMTPEHAIQFIDCYVDDTYVSRVELTPGVNPSAVFHLRAQGSTVRIVENCNVHGYWQKEAAL
jgi:desulfoferrodoxin-like iron-binding protein